MPVLLPCAAFSHTNAPYVTTAAGAVKAAAATTAASITITATAVVGGGAASRGGGEGVPDGEGPSQQLPQPGEWLKLKSFAPVYVQVSPQYNNVMIAQAAQHTGCSSLYPCPGICRVRVWAACCPSSDRHPAHSRATCCDTRPSCALTPAGPAAAVGGRPQPRHPAEARASARSRRVSGLARSTYAPPCVCFTVILHTCDSHLSATDGLCRLS